MTSDMVAIDTSGDVTLVCGAKVGDGKTTTIRVSSAIMSYASPVFKSMLAPRFKEGTVLATTSTVEIPLEEDDPDNMVLVCKILHMDYDSLPARLSADQLLALAETCDNHAVEHWFSLALATADHKNRTKLHAAAELLRNDDLVHHVSVDMVMGSKSSDELPVKMAMARHKAWDECVTSIQKAVDEQRPAVRQNSNCSLTCTVGLYRTVGLLDQLALHGLWPMDKKKSLDTICTVLDNIKLRDPDNVCACEACRGCLKGYNGSELELTDYEYKSAAVRVRKIVSDSDFKQQ